MQRSDKISNVSAILGRKCTVESEPKHEVATIENWAFLFWAV